MTRSKSMLTALPSMSKTSPCFICGNEFPYSELTEHEKNCFESMQLQDEQDYSESKDLSSSRSSLHEYSSVVSTNSASSTESVEKKKARCYICGSDVPSYLSKIHEKSCKKTWESSLVSPSTPKSSKEKSFMSNTPDARKNSGSGISLKKSYSVADLSSQSSDLGNKKFKNRNLTKLDSVKSKSYANLSSTPINNSKKANNSFGGSTPKLNKTNSLQNLSKQKETPMYVECRTCGKQYSKHSINIHVKQCEKTLELQKKAGTNSEYKKKSKSLHDLSAISPFRPTSANNKTLTKKTISIENLTSSTPNKNRQEKKKSKQNGSVFAFRNTSTSEYSDESSQKIIEKSTSPSPVVGFQKCYLCKQLFGSRSLPIHEKQCVKKWERSLEENKNKIKKKRHSQSEIKVIPFGKLNTEEKKTEDSEVFVDDSRADENVSNFDNTNSLPQNEKENVINYSRKSAKTFGFVNCIYCSRSYGKYSIEIHEKNCRERGKFENPAEKKANLNENCEKNESVLLETPVTQKLDLIKCEDCNRKFLSSAIEKHKMHCR